MAEGKLSSIIQQFPAVKLVDVISLFLLYFIVVFMLAKEEAEHLSNIINDFPKIIQFHSVIVRRIQGDFKWEEGRDGSNLRGIGR